MFVVAVPFLVMFWCYLEILLMVRRNHRKKVIMTKRSGSSKGRTELQLTMVSLQEEQEEEEEDVWWIGSKVMLS